jgi:hypothetical protein
MNKHIELVKKWLADPESVRLKELESNKNAAWTAWAADDDNAYWAAYRTAWAAYKAAQAAYRTAANADAHADHCKQKAIEAVREYGDLTK